MTIQNETNIDLSSFTTLKTASNVVSAIVFMGCIGASVILAFLLESPLVIAGGILAGITLAQSPRTVNQWEKAVVLRLGTYVGLKGPGLFWIIPLFDTITTVIDERVVTTGFAAEQTLTADTVPVTVDAVLFWKVIDPEKAALSVQDYKQAISWAAQTTLRDIIGRTSLAKLLSGREMIEHELQKVIADRVNGWGLVVHSVEMRDVVIPASLQDAMSREAQAEREKNARVILGQAEVEIAGLFQEAAKSYEKSPAALHLRAMNMLYEGLKEKGALMMVPSSALDSMGLGGLMGAAALRQQAITGPVDPNNPEC